MVDNYTIQYILDSPYHTFWDNVPRPHHQRNNLDTNQEPTKNGELDIASDDISSSPLSNPCTSILCSRHSIGESSFRLRQPSDSFHHSCPVAEGAFWVDLVEVAE